MENNTPIKNSNSTNTNENKTDSNVLNTIQNGVEKNFESILWNSRMVLVFGVIACVVTGIGVVLLGVYEVFKLLSYLFTYITGEGDLSTRDTIILYVIKILDTFLLSSILFIFSFGLYELFISPLDNMEQRKFASKAFEITSIDQLKAKLGKVVILLLVIKVFAHLLEIHPTTMVETVYLAIIVLCMALSLWIGQKK